MLFGGFLEDALFRGFFGECIFWKCKFSVGPVSERATHGRRREEGTDQAAAEEQARNRRLVGSIEPA
jgi:hypothetical protein